MGDNIKKNFVRYNNYKFAGISIDIPVYHDSHSNMDLEEYPNFIDNPIYTPDGRPLTLAFEDACPNAERLYDEPCIACTDCKFFQRAAEKTLFGYCKNDKNTKR